MKPIYLIDTLSEYDREWVAKQSIQKELSLNNALNYLDHDTLVEWLKDRIDLCKQELRNAFKELEYKRSLANGWPPEPLNERDLYGFYGITPVSPAAYCLYYKWLPIYENELTKTSTTGDVVYGFEQYIIYADSPRKAKAKAMLHDLIDGKQGKWVALVIRCCINCGLITKPKYSDLIAEFGNVIGKSNYKKYLSETTMPPEMVKKETDAIEKRLSELL